MFIAIGVVGAALLIVFLMFGDLFDDIIPDADWISGPALGAFLAAFGLFGWMIQSGTSAGNGVAAIVGAAGGIGLGYATYRLTRALAKMPTDGTPSPSSYVGREGKVVTAVTPGSVGEVLVSVGGQAMKLTAITTSTEALARGTDVVVIAAESPTKVIVQAASDFWGDTER